jgi:hypothetical protein
LNDRRLLIVISVVMLLVVTGVAGGFILGSNRRDTKAETLKVATYSPPVRTSEPLRPLRNTSTSRPLPHSPQRQGALPREVTVYVAEIQKLEDGRAALAKQVKEESEKFEKIRRFRENANALTSSPENASPDPSLFQSVQAIFVATYQANARMYEHLKGLTPPQECADLHRNYGAVLATEANAVAATNNILAKCHPSNHEEIVRARAEVVSSNEAFNLSIRKAVTQADAELVRVYGTYQAAPPFRIRIY